MKKLEVISNLKYLAYVHETWGGGAGAMNEAHRIAARALREQAERLEKATPAAFRAVDMPKRKPE